MTAKELCELLMSDKPSEAIKSRETEVFELIPTLEDCKGFDQKNIWHTYDVYEHILHVVDGVPKDINLRLAALFHDVGKPSKFVEDENGVGHFKGHWDVSKEVFDEFATKLDIDEKSKTLITNLILYHDMRFRKMTESDLKQMYKDLGEDGIKKLYALKRADVRAQNEIFYYSEENQDNLNNLDKQEEYILSKFADKDVER